MPANRIPILIFLFGTVQFLNAQSIPPLINYQGRLTDQTGAPLSASAYTIQFRLWSDPTAKASTNLIWSQQQGVTVQTNGTFDVILGSSAGSPISGDFPTFTNVASAFGSSSIFLGVTVAVSNGVIIASPSEILPRQQLLSVPFAIQAQQAASLVSNLANALCPPGTVVAYMGTNAPPGWLLCDGSAISRTYYASLFAVIGTASGAGDGATTFNLPDMRGIFLRGANGSRSDSFADLDDTTLRTNIFTGGNTGNTVGSYQEDMFKSHTHSYTYFGLQNFEVGFADGTQANNYVQNGTTAAAGGTETRPKNVYVNYIIKY